MSTHTSKSFKIIEFFNKVEKNNKEIYIYFSHCSPFLNQTESIDHRDYISAPSIHISSIMCFASFFYIYIIAV
jgi:hypothetical protein